MTAPELYQIIIGVLSNQNLIAKGILILLIAVYILFTLVLAVQIRILNRIINQIHFSPVFKFLALLHTVFAVLLLVGVTVTL